MSLYESGVRPIIDNYLLEESKKVRSYGDYWSASSAGYCQRKVIFERLGVPKNNEDARRQRVFSSGHVFHSWIQELTKKAGVSIAQEEELQDEELMIRGHFDDLVKIDGKLMLVDYKTVNSRSFIWAKKNGNAMSYFHRLQLGTYMYMLRNSGYKDLSESRILKIEKDALMLGEQQLLWSPELESEVVNYWKTLNAHWNKKTLPSCTCADHESGFMAKEQYNGYYLDGEPCSLKLYTRWKESKNEVLQTPTV